MKITDMTELAYAIRDRLRESRTRVGTAQKSQFSETMLFGVLEDADDDGHSHFSYRRSFAAVISAEFYLGSRTRLIFAFIKKTEEFWKNCFRRHAVWSQRDVDMKNDYAHRHPHPREPQTT
ncbi:hypothetical protein PRIPAC_81245 [Pristionchus pacificus]|uniref:Uncharacterized protein n=1 Tax=Pristionchus pacificus TaxID=54126 RepID=A0A2A6CJC4_PRIPA|nr:hypothetical protein PRIPAC_81245 [Pristionchus pacificus]|eukprot:PDM78210.1 hypothetical protein PRIPAC_30789 [Pristionchus pacificus]